MSYKAGFTTMALLLAMITAFAQQKLSGIVVEKSSGEPVAFATVQSKGVKNTLTNESGEFEISVPALPAVVKVSHLNFQDMTLQVNQPSGPLKVELTSRTLVLKEVTIGNPATAIMQDVADKALKDYQHSNYGKAFLRQIAYDQDKPTYMNEIFLNAEWKPYGLVAWKPTQARHLKAASGVSYTNTSFFSFILSGFLANSIHKKPVLRKVDSLYSFKLAGTYDQNGEEIAKITCTPKSKLKGLRFQGNYYVNTATNNVLKIEGTLLALHFTGGGPVSITNKETTFIAQYRLNDAGYNVLDYSIFNTSNSIRLLGLGVQHTDLYSTLYMTDDDQINKTELKEVSGDIDDSSLVKAMNFDADFWKNNPGIKRTTKEQSAIEILEKTSPIK